jgi:hypothetical protein
MLVRYTIACCASMLHTARHVHYRTCFSFAHSHSLHGFVPRALSFDGIFVHDAAA